MALFRIPNTSALWMRTKACHFPTVAQGPFSAEKLGRDQQEGRNHAWHQQQAGTEDAIELTMQNPCGCLNIALEHWKYLLHSKNYYHN